MQDSHARYDALVAATPDAIVTIDTTGAIVSFNVAAERMFGYLASEMIGRNVSVLMPEPYRSQHDTFIRRYLSTGENQVIGIGREVRALRSDGRLFLIELSVCEVRTDVDHLFTGIIRDISARRALELRLAESERAAVIAQLDAMRRIVALERELQDLRARYRHSPGSTGKTKESDTSSIFKGARFLVVDDDHNMHQIVRGFLRLSAAVVDCVSNGMEAIEAIELSVADDREYSAILLDLHMPAMDGLRTATELRRIEYRGPLVVLTADIHSAQQLALIPGPVDHWLTKPFGRTQLIEILKQVTQS